MSTEGKHNLDEMYKAAWLLFFLKAFVVTKMNNI